MIKILILALLIGVLTKFTDMEPSKRITKRAIPEIISGLFYGFLTVLAIKLEPIIASLFIATVIGVTISGKIDAIGHFFGISSFIFFMAIFGLPPIHILLLLLFLTVAFTDEMINTYIVDAKKIKSKSVGVVLGIRPLLEVAAFVVSLITGIWVIWLSLLFYDLGFNLVRFKYNHKN